MNPIFKIVGMLSLDGYDQVSQQLTDVANQGEQSSNGLSSAFKKLAGVVATAFSVAKIKEFSNECVAAYQVQQLAETKLETVMKQRMGATDESIQSVKDYASELQNLGVVGDEVALSGAQQLATFLNTDSALKTLLPAMENLAVQQNGVNVTGEAMVSIGNMFGKVMQGQTSALSRVGITFSEAQEEILKYGTEEERAATLAHVIQDNVGNMNEVIAQTDSGRIQQYQNTIGDVKEEIGEKLIPIQAEFYEKLKDLWTWVSDTAIPAVEQFTQFLKDHEEAMTYVGVAIGTVTALIIAYNIQQALATSGTTLWGAIAGIATGATTALGAAFTFLTSPIGLIIIAIGALIAIGIALYKHWDDVKEKATQLWNSIKERFNGIYKAIEEPLNKAKNFVKGIIDSIVGLFSGAKFTWPKIPMPHFAVTPKGWGIGDLLKGKIPKLGIDWYAKAMDEGMIMNQPTAFGVNANGQIMAGGEAGPEAIVGVRSLRDMIRESNNQDDVVSMLTRLFDLLNKYMPELLNKQTVVYSESTDSINRKLYMQQMKEARVG